MNLYILRHGIAAPGLPAGIMPDALRPLTPKGRKKMAGIAEAMKSLEPSFGLILSSPCVRARQTAGIVADAHKAGKKLEILKELSTGVGPETLLNKLAGQHLLPENVLLVGHEPQLSGLISLLVAGSSALQIQLKKGGLCKLSLPSLKTGRRATLEWLLTPRQMLDLR
jgi:phosphohistidine phosphatase